MTKRAALVSALLGSLGLAFTSTQSAHAALILELTAYDTTGPGQTLVGSPVTVSDNGGLDGSSVLDEISYFGSIGDVAAGVNFDLTFTYAYSLNSPSPYLGISSLDLTGTGGVLQLAVSDTDFMLNGSPWMYSASLSGLSSGYVSLASYVDYDNTPFGTTLSSSSLLGNLGPAGGIFNESYTGAVATPYNYAPFSLTQLLTVDHSGGRGGTIFGAGGSISAPYVSVSEAPTIALFGIGLAGLGLMGWRRRKLD